MCSKLKKLCIGKTLYPQDPIPVTDAPPSTCIAQKISSQEGKWIATCLVITRTIIPMCNAVTHHQVGVEKALHFVDGWTFVFLIILTPEVIAIPEIFSCYHYKATVRDKLIMKNLIMTD